MLFRDKKYEISPQFESRHPTISCVKQLLNISNVSDSDSHSLMMPSLLILTLRRQDSISHSMNSITGLMNWQAIPPLRSQHVTYSDHAKGSRKYRSDPNSSGRIKMPKKSGKKRSNVFVLDS